MKKNIFFGYYDQDNFGDEQYKTTFKKLVSGSIEYISIDKVNYLELDSNCNYYLGGGDVLNEYFLKPIYNKFKKTTFQIIAISVGIPFPSILSNHPEYFSIFSKIYLRTKQDIQLLGHYYPPSRIDYLPDVSILCSPIATMTPITKRKHLIISLAQPVSSETSGIDCHSFITGLSLFISRMVSKKKYTVSLVPFNTSDNERESDYIINKRVMELLPAYVKKRVNCITEKYSIEQMNTLFGSATLVIPMRFHATLFAMNNCVPMIPIFTTRKITNFLKDIKWPIFYNLDDSRFDVDLLLKFVEKIEKTNTVLCEFLMTIHKSMNKNFQNISINSNNTDTMNTDSNTQKRIDNTLTIINNFIAPKHFPRDFSLLAEYQCEKIVQIISFGLTDSINSIYNYGLASKLGQSNFKQEWEWVINDHIQQLAIQPIIRNKNMVPKYNIEFMDQYDTSGVHRSGWKYVTDALLHYNGNDENLILLDLYADRTFHWENDINKILGIIPYTKPWVGIIHHTFDETFSKHNNETLFECQEFSVSLRCCDSIIVLSKYLQNQVQDRLKKLGYKIPVHYICHPTEITVPQFSMMKFKSNNHKQIINIGGWLRNIYSFYSLIIPETLQYKKLGFKQKPFPLYKSALKGIGMNNYYPDYDTTLQISTKKEDNRRVACSSGGITTNIWHKHLINHIDEIIHSVSIIDRLTDSDYDELLACNVVFVNLIDASAVNTILECVARNTPIIVNKHPAVVEILGDKYPLYYNSASKTMNIDIYNMITWDNIEKAFQYLTRIPKEQFGINVFIKNFNKLFK